MEDLQRASQRFLDQYSCDISTSDLGKTDLLVALRPSTLVMPADCPGVKGTTADLELVVREEDVTAEACNNSQQPRAHMQGDGLLQQKDSDETAIVPSADAGALSHAKHASASAGWLNQAR
jgi:hypothetical protein